MQIPEGTLLFSYFFALLLRAGAPATATVKFAKLRRRAAVQTAWMVRVL